MTVRTVITGKLSDYEAYSGLAKRMTAHVEANEPGILAYEWFGDEASGAVLIHEIYESEEAFLTHFGYAQESGALDELMGMVEIESITSLNRVNGDDVKAIMEQLGAKTLHGVAGLTR